MFEMALAQWQMGPEQYISIFHGLKCCYQCHKKPKITFDIGLVKWRVSGAPQSLVL